MPATPKRGFRQRAGAEETADHHDRHDQAAREQDAGLAQGSQVLGTSMPVAVLVGPPAAPPA